MIISITILPVISWGGGEGVVGVQEEITEGAWLFPRPHWRCLLGEASSWTAGSRESRLGRVKECLSLTLL